MDKPVEWLLSDAIHTILADLTLSSSEVLYAATDAAIPPEPHQWLLSGSSSCSNRLVKDPFHGVALKAALTSRSIHWTKEVVFGGRNTI